MKASQAFRKGNPLKAYELYHVRGQKSLQKYQIDSPQSKMDNKIYTTKPPNKGNPSQKIKSNSPLNSINSTKVPIISSFEKKIREAIENRYQKSKIKDFKYEKSNVSDIKKESGYYPLEIDLQNDSPEESEKSEDMEEMIKFGYLKNQAFVSIHQYHTSKSNVRRQSTIFKESIRKRKFKIINSKSIQGKEIFSNNTKSIQKIPFDLGHQLKSLSPKASKGFQLDLNNIQSNKQQKLRFEEQKRKSLTSRSIDGFNQMTSFIYSDAAFAEKTPKHNLKANPCIIKDTFKLKNTHKFHEYPSQPDQDLHQVNPCQDQDVARLYNNANEKSERSLNNIRRLLIKKNQKTIQTQFSNQNKKKLNLSHQSIPKTQNKKVFSAKKIQTEIIEHPQETQKKTPYHKNIKEKSKTKSAYTNEFAIKQGQMNHSNTQQKWKLEEISFRFKAIDEQKTQFPVEKINNFIQKNQKGLNMGLSIEKAYNKIISGRKVQNRKIQNFDNRRTIIPKNEQNAQKLQTIVHQAHINREERSVSKNKRRKLRLRTDADFENNKRDSEAISTAKNSRKNIQTPQNSALIESQLKESTINSKDKQKKQLMTTTNYRSRQKVDRFSTIN